MRYTWVCPSHEFRCGEYRPHKELDSDWYVSRIEDLCTDTDDYDTLNHLCGCIYHYKKFCKWVVGTYEVGKRGKKKRPHN